MRLTKKALTAEINKCRSVEAIRLSNDELKMERTKKVREVKAEIDRKLRQNRPIMIVFLNEQ